MHDNIDFNAVPDILPVLQRICTVFNGVLPIPETAFVMTCKKIRTLLSFSVGPLTTPLQQITLVDVIEDIVIAFVLRVLPSTADTFDASTFLLSLSSLISLLGAVESHISNYADFTLQLRMVAIFQLLHDNEEVAMILSLLNTLHPVSQELPLNANPPLYSVSSISHAPSPVLSVNAQLLILEPFSLSSQLSTFVTNDYEPYLPSSPVSHCSVQDFSGLFVSGATSLLQNLSPPSLSRSSSAPNIQMTLTPEVVSSTVRGDQLSVGNYDANSVKALLQELDWPPSPLFTPDPNVSRPTMKTDIPVSRLASDSSGRRHTVDISVSFPLSDRPQPLAQSPRPVSSKAFIMRDDPFYNTFHTASEAFSLRPKEGYILDSSSLVTADSDLQILSKSIKGKEKDVSAAFVKIKARSGEDNITVSDNGHTLTGGVERKRAASMHSMNKENLKAVE